MRYVTEPERPLLFIVLLCHGKLTAGQQDYSYIKLQISQEKPLGLSIGFYFFGGMGPIACVLRWPCGGEKTSMKYFELRNDIVFNNHSEVLIKSFLLSPYCILF